MLLSSLGPFLRPCLSNSYPPGATLPAGFFSPWWGSSPAGAFCYHASALRASFRVASVAALCCIFFFRLKLHPDLFFFRPAPVMRLRVAFASHPFPCMASPVALCGPFRRWWGLYIRPPVLRSGSFWGPSCGWSRSRHGRVRSGRVRRGPADFLRGLP